MFRTEIIKVRLERIYPFIKKKAEGTKRIELLS